MTPGARVQSAIEVLDDILTGKPAEQALTNWSRRSRFAGSKDRQAVRDHVFDVLRALKSSCATGGAKTGRAAMIGYLTRNAEDWVPLFGADRHGPVVLTPEELALSKAPPALDRAESLDLPDWIVPHFEAALGKDVEAVAGLFRQRAPLFLRANLSKTTVESLALVLENEGITATTHVKVPAALKVEGNPRRLRNLQAFEDGLFEFQDAGSQQVVNWLGALQGRRILDLCAGGGGKSLALAAKGANVTASDVSMARMKDLPVRAQRAQLVVDIVSNEKIDRLAPFDMVFCDVPCSGTGAWRRQPDQKWKFAAGDLENLQETQAQILDRATGLLKSSGQLIYVTCSILRSENEDQVGQFLKRNEGWELVQSTRLSPLEGGDGFFAARLQRTNAQSTLI